MAKQFCKQCGLKLEPWNPMKELLQATRKPELEPVEFADGKFCKRCAVLKRNNSHKAKQETKEDFF